jgi:hypothetical protein
MKLKIDKQFLYATGIAACAALAIMVVMLLLSLISWGLVFAALMIMFMPIAHSAVKFYKSTNCIDLEDFFAALVEDEEDIAKRKKEDHDFNSLNW